MQKTWRSSVLLAYSLAVLAFLYLPLIILALYSFNSSRINAVWTGFTLKWYLALFQNTRVLEALTNTLIIGIISTIVSTTLGTTTAIALHRYQFKMKSFINGLVYLPILIPEIVMGLSLLVLFSQCHLPLGKPTLILAHITFCVSFVIITVGARMEGMRGDLEQAASDLYATPWQTFRYITLPLIMPGIIAGALIAFTLSIDDFVISFFVAGPNSTTLPLYIYAMVKRGISPEINALSTLMMCATVSMVVIAEILQPRTKSHKSEE
jgi:spermidine/putrescine transport system permease protein